MIAEFTLILTLASLLFWSLLRRKKKVHFGFIALALIMAIPGLLIPFYYSHFLDNFVWYYNFRSIPFIEYSLIFTAPLFALIACRFIKLKSLCYIALFVTIALPYYKHLVTPLDIKALENKVIDGVTMQSSMSTCGPSCLATILRAKGLEYSEVELAKACHTTKTGTEIWHIKRFLDRLGLESPFIIDQDTSPIYPAIAGTYGHFIAIFSKDQHYTIADPLVGKDIISEKYLRKRINTGFYLHIKNHSM